MLTNTSLSNLVILATLSSSVVTFNHDSSSNLMPKMEASFDHHVNVTEWKDKAFNESNDYSFHNEDITKMNSIVSFTKNLLENSIDIESEYVDIVNENFWDLI